MHVNTPSSQGWGLSLGSLAVLQHGQGSRAHFRGKIKTIDTHPQPVINRLAQVFGTHPPNGKGPDVVLLFERRSQFIHRDLMPDHLIALRRGRLRHAFNLDTGPDLAWLKGLLGHLIMREELAAVATTVPVEPGPVIARALVALFIAPPAPFG